MTYGVVDLFCGVGGLTCGLEAAGLDVVAGYDLDSSCEYTYTHNNNAIFINRNVEEVTGKEIKKLLRGYAGTDPADDSKTILDDTDRGSLHGSGRVCGRNL